MGGSFFTKLSYKTPREPCKRGFCDTFSKKIHINFKKGLDKMHKALYNELNVQEMHEKEEVYHVH